VEISCGWWRLRVFGWNNVLHVVLSFSIANLSLSCACMLTKLLYFFILLELDLRNVTSAKDFVVVCLYVIFREAWQWTNKQVTKFRWRSGSPSGYRDCFRIRHYWEIRKVVNGHRSAAHTDLPYGDTGKTYLGGSMHCPCASGCK